MAAIVEGIQLEQTATVSFSSPPPPPVIDLATQADVRLESTESAYPGEIVAVGDFDGDGYDDLIVGNPHARPGLVYIMYGEESLTGYVNFNTSIGTIISGEYRWDYFGSSLACGDVNNDGKDDIIIGAPGYEGKVYIIWGRANRVTRLNLNPGTPGVCRIIGGNPGDKIGHSVAVGNFVPNQYADVLIGAPGADKSGNGNNEGKVFVLQGLHLRYATLINLYPYLHKITIVGEDQGDQIGYGHGSICFSEITSNYPYAEIIISSPEHIIPNYIGKGSVYVIGVSSSNNQTYYLQNCPLVKRIDNLYVNNATFPITISSGDFDGNANNDLVISAPGYSSGRGRSCIFYNIGSYLVFGAWIYGVAQSDYLGDAMVVGDFNNDDDKDLILFASNGQIGQTRAGVGYMFSGGTRFYGSIYLADPFAPVDLVIHGLPRDEIGRSAAVGDVDGDGKDDLLIGAPGSRNSTGEAYVVLGTTLNGSLSKQFAERPMAAEESALVPEQYVLEQNHPNPFNPETEICFQIPEERRVQMTIYNIRGQVIRQLVEQSYQAGSHVIMWDGRDEFNSNVPSGIYLYRMQAGEFVTTKKMILAR